jgi:hypothetical protein
MDYGTYFHSSSYCTMTNYCNYELIAQLWEDILQKHWDYLDAEETLAKFEMRKELESKFVGSFLSQNF